MDLNNTVNIWLLFNWSIFIHYYIYIVNKVFSIKIKCRLAVNPCGLQFFLLDILSKHPSAALFDDFNEITFSASPSNNNKYQRNKIKIWRNNTIYMLANGYYLFHQNIISNLDTG